jgi:predicted ABC-type sugar transport system permease subunit
MSAVSEALSRRPWIWSFAGALLVWLAAIQFTGGYGAGGMLTAALSLAVFTVIVGFGQMFVITLGPGNVDLSLPANIGLASAVAMKVMGGEDSMVALGLLAALASGLCVGIVNFLLIWALRIPPIVATLSASFVIQSVDISYGRGLQIKPPPGFADFANILVFGVPLLAILTLLLAVGAGLALHRTVYGRSVLAIGQNIRAARLAGVRSSRRDLRPMPSAARWAASTAHCSQAISAAPMSTSATNICCSRSPSSSSAAPRSRAARPIPPESGAARCSWCCCRPCSIPSASAPVCACLRPALSSSR